MQSDLLFVGTVTLDWVRNSYLGGLGIDIDKPAFVVSADIEGKNVITI